MDILIVIFLVIVIVTAFWGLSTVISLIGGIHFVFSTNNVIKKSLELAKLKKGEKFLELGSGTGRGLLIAANCFGAKATGVEISPFHYFVSKILTYKNKSINIKMGDFRRVDLSNFDVVYCYLSPKLMEILSLKFKKELPHGARVVSYCFEIPDIIPKKVEIISGKKIYLYKF